MNRKLIFGIIIPLAVIIVLVSLSTINIGFSAKKQTIPSVGFFNIFVSSYGNSNVFVQKITIKNDFFMPKTYKLPLVDVCLYDKDNQESSQTLGTLKYMPTEHGYVSSEDVLITNSNYYSNNEKIEIPSNEEKSVSAFVTPKYYYKSDMTSYDAYDEIVLVERKDQSGSYNYYSPCSTLSEDDLKNAIHIAIANKPLSPNLTATAILSESGLYHGRCSSQVRDGICPSECDMIYDSDCTEKAGYLYTSAGIVIPSILNETDSSKLGKYDCSSKEDGFCPFWCNIDTDYDCCTKLHSYLWIEGRGCMH
jgi:hypothetical protein